MDKPVSLARRLMLILIVSSVMVSLGMVAIVQTIFQQQIQATLTSKAEGTLDYLVGSLAMPIWNMSDETVRQIAHTAAQDEIIGVIEVSDFGRQKLFYAHRHGDQEHLIHASRVIEHEGFQIGEVRIGLNPRHYDRQLGTWIKSLLLAAGLIIVLSALVVTVLLRRFLRAPLAELTNVVKAYGAGQYSSGLEVRYAEFQPFGQVLHEMGTQIVDQLQKLDDINRALQVDEARLNAMLSLSESTARMSERDLIQHGLEEAQRLTGSKIGFLHVINRDQDTAEFHTWSHATRDICTAAYQSHYPVAQAGIWADAVRCKRPVTHNDYQTAENRRGLPEGHAPLVRHMVVPAMESDQVRMIVGVGNKPEPYDDSDLRQLQLIGDNLWKIISLRRTMTELEVARDAAEAASVAKSAFLANVSHEMRTPLNHITGLAELVRHEPLSERQAEWMNKLVMAARNLADTIGTVLELTKIEAGKLDAAEEPFSVEDLVSSVVAGAQESAAAKQLQLTTESAPVPASLIGHKEPVRQALLNYVSNAIRFTNSGKVTVRLQPVVEDDLSMLLRFEVQDTGIGIMPEDQARLFSIFEQVDNSSTRKYAGLGVGLAMTRKIVRLMGGDAGCTSAPGAGSTFWFTVRLKKT
jgi:signal transduction histidine kinase